MTIYELKILTGGCAGDNEGEFYGVGDVFKTKTPWHKKRKNKYELIREIEEEAKEEPVLDEDPPENPYDKYKDVTDDFEVPDGITVKRKGYDYVIFDTEASDTEPVNDAPIKKRNVAEFIDGYLAEDVKSEEE